MGFFNKIKDLFTDEVEDSEPIKKEVIKVEIATPKNEEFEPSTNISDSDIVNKPEKNPTPVFFSDSDFEDLRYKDANEEQQPKKGYRYNQPKDEKTKEKEEPKIFKSSPIISPVYGILDKNYSKDDITVKSTVKPEIAVSSKELTIDLVRKKAFGTLEEDLETELFNSNSILFKEELEEPEEKDIFEELKNKEEISSYNNDEDNDNVFDDLTIDDVSVSEPIEENSPKENMIADELEKMFEEDDKLTEGDLFDLIDSMYEKGEDNNE